MWETFKNWYSNAFKWAPGHNTQVGGFFAGIANLVSGTTSSVSDSLDRTVNAINGFNPPEAEISASTGRGNQQSEDDDSGSETESESD